VIVSKGTSKDVGIIINADDFGMSEKVNRAIVTCFQEGVISSTTIMANMEGFENACRLAIENNLSGRVGVHLNVSEGRPLSTSIRKEPTFVNGKGEFCFRRNSHLVLKRNEKTALLEEFERQITRCVDMGLSLTHLDSHQHVHTEWSVFSVIRALVKKYGLRFVRTARNDGNSKPALGRLYKALFNIRLSHMGLRRTTYFGDVAGFRRMQELGTNQLKSFEIMIHPIIGEHGVVVDKMDGMEIVPTIKALMQGFRLSSYRTLRGED